MNELTIRTVTVDTFPVWVFGWLMIIVGIGWLALIFFPRRHWANFWLTGVIIPSFFGVLYTALMIIYSMRPPTPSPTSFLDLLSVKAMFENHGMLIAAWTDILLLSLIAGAWVTRKAAQTGMPYIYLLPILLLMFAVPGTGIVVFFVVLTVRNRLNAVSNVERPSPTETTPASALPAGARS